jgi:hypothetical protein
MYRQTDRQTDGQTDELIRVGLGNQRFIQVNIRRYKVLTIDLTSTPIPHATMSIAGVLQVMRIQETTRK